MSNKVAFITLGCKLNFSESSTLARMFAAQGWEEVPPGPDVDCFVVNTCSVTEHADKKCRNLIRRLHKLSPEARIAVTGCYAQLKPQEVLGIEGVDLVVGAGQNWDGSLSAAEAGNTAAPAKSTRWKVSSRPGRRVSVRVRS